MEALQAKVTIAWLDWGDPQQLRPKDMQKLLQVYADGQLLSSDSYTITEEGPADFYGMEAYSYLISSLPVYAQAEAAESEEVTEGEEAAEEAEAGTPISYVVKQDTSLLTAYQNLDPLMLAVLLNPDAESEEELVVTEEQAAAFLAMDGEWAVTPEDGSAPARAFVNFFADGVVLAETKKETDWETDASVQTQVVWFDAINGKAYTHDGELLPSISYTVDGEQYDLSLTWDAQAIDNGDGTFRAAYSYTYTQEDADRLGVTAGEKLVITDTGDNNLNRTLAAANLTSKRIDRTLTQGTNSETGEPEWTVTEEKTTDITWSPISIGFWNGTENGPDNSKYPTPNVSRYSRKEEKNPDGSVSYTMYPMQNLVIDIEFRAGIENAKDHPGWAKTLFEQTGISMNGKDVNGDPGFNFDENLTDFWDQLLETYGARRSDFTLTGPDSDGRYHYTILNVPVYNTDKKQITYTLDTKEETLNVNASGDWYFTIENDNKNVPGYGTDVSQGYNGGTVILTRTNTTEYRATKIWQDELTKEERQSTDWTLWRYAARQGDTFEMAAQVFMDADNKTITIVATDKNGDVTKTFVNTFNWTTSGETIEHFLIENLPKYNSDGYEYTYFAREANLDSSYVRHFGAYTDGEFQEESAEETANREKTGYRGINNGGAVANQKTQYIPISVTKEWVAARYQNDLSNIQVVVKLKAKHVHSQGDDAKDSWHDVLDGNGNPRTLTLEGFTAYQLTQTRTMEVDQYCSEGHELEFMWEEVAIYELETDEAGNLLKDEDGNYNVKKEIYKEKKVIDGEEQDIFCLSINSKAVETDSFPHADEYFVSNSNSNDQLGDGQVITNTLEGTTEYFVKKTWDETLTAGPITISLKAYDSAGRDVTQELTDKGYALEKTLKEDTPLTIKDENNKDTAYGGNYESRDSQWVHLFEDLPKYDAEGNLYNYIIREYGTTINGTMPEYHYGNDVDDDTVDEKQSVLIHNAPVPGVVQYIDVRKVWLDDSVTAGRDDCKFAIYAGTYPNGRLLYGKNDDDSNGLLGDYVIVAEGSNWWRHVDVTVFAYCVNVSGTIHYLTYGQLQQNWETLTEYDEKGQQVNNQDTDMLTWARNHLVKDFYVVEAAIGDNQVGTASDTRPSSQGYPVTLGGDGVTCYATIYNRSSGGNKECTDQRDVRGYYTVLNRRIGALKYAITKKWVDGSQDADYRQSWKATLKLSCVESPEAVQDMTSKETEEISGYVRMPIAPEKEEAGSGESSAIMDILANEEYGWRSILDDAGNPVRTEQQLGNTAVDSNTERVVYTNLPMYDYLGRLIHYEITETMKGKTDPVTGETKQEYEIIYGEVSGSVTNPSTSNQTQTVTNLRNENYNYKWHLLWLDQYRYDNRQRPDVYLSLYQREYQYEDDGTPKRDKDGNHLYDIVKLPYKDYLWTQESDASNTEDYWTAGFDLPKYDDHGTEIIYYASISTVVNYIGIDYIGAQFGEGEVKDIDSFLKDDNLLNQSEVVYDKITGKFVVTHKENSSITEFFPQGNKNGLPLLEADNTFVEQIREKVNVIGRKIWENIPTGFPTNELPGLTFNLYRFKMNHSGQFLDGEDKPVSDEPDLNTRPRKVENHVLKVYAADNTAMTGEPVATYQVELMARVERVQSPGVDYEFKMNWVGFNDLEGNPIIGEDNAKRWSKLGGLNEGAEAYGKPMAKYDANGNMYRYAVVETMPSDDTWENLGNAYENLCGSINGYYITNTFDTVNNVAPIRVSKDWNFPNLNLKDDETPKFPERTEFKLYRFYKTVDGFGTPPVPSYAEPEEVATTVLEGREASYNWAAGNESTVTFRNPGATQADKDTQWPIYAPNGNPYIYFVGETPLDGYEEAKLTLNSGGVFDDPTGEGWPDLKDPQYSWASPAFKLEDQTAEVQVGVENKYTGEDHVDLTGSKVWRDYGGVFGTRPNSLILYLYRSAKEVNEYVGKLTLTLGGNGLSPAWNHTSPGPKNESPATNVTGDIKVTTELSEDKKTWTYHITGLDGYHTYAVPYTYKVQEDITNLGDYTAENGGAATGKTDTERNTVTMGDLTNSLTTSLTVEKLWKAGDDKPPVKMPPVVVKLQISDDNGKTWQWADAYFVKYFKNNGDFTYEEFLKEYQVVFDKELTPGHWSTEFIHLPKGIFKGEAKTFQYRAREIKIDDLEVKWDADLKTIVSIGGKPYNGTGYLIITEDDQDGTITNAFRETQFSVTKIWEGDENNRYGTRGDVDDEDTTTWSVSFHIYRSYQGNNGTPEILKYPGSDVDFVVTVSGVNRDDNATATVNNLPAQAPNGETYKYFAVELNPNGTEVSRNPIGDYNGTYGVVYDDGKDANTTTVTNTMNPTQLTVTKNWVGDQTSFRPENLPLTLYRRIQGTTGEGTKVPNAPAASWNKGNGNTWTATYGPLPKKDPSGNVYEYYVTEQTKDGYERPLYGTDSGAAGSKPNGEYWEETITNTATQFTLDKVSETASTEKLNGVTLVFQSSDNQWTLTWERNADGEERYEIKKGQGSWSASGEKENGGFVTGPVQITGLPVGKTFILKSETPPKGYVMPKGTVSFKLKADGTLSIVSGANTYLTLGTDNLALTLADPETQITLKKLNQENTEITEGYTFKLHGIFHTENGDKEEDRTLAPDSKVKEVKDGELMVSTNASSPEYTYTLTETGAPDGYKLSNVTVKFYLDVNGTVHILEGQSVATANGSTVSFKDDPFTLTVRKQEENANRFPAGAEFELKEHETNKVLGKFTTGKNGSVTINSTATNPKLKVDGIYVLTETKAPDGYLLPEENARSKTFQIQDDGTALTGTIDASGSFTPGTDPETAMLTFTDKPIKITLKKINVETNEGLSGARFRLDRKTSDNPEKWTTVRSGVTTGKDGTVLLWDAANGPYVVQGGTYRLVETQAPAGYVTEGTTEFTVSGDGKTVTVTGEAPSDTITVTNRKTSFKIMKRDNELEKPLSGATLAIYEYDASDDTHKGKRIATWETDGMGHTLDGVPEGEYILCEEVTPEGFAQIPSLHFKLREGNQIQLIGASTTHFALGEPEQGSDVYTIYAIDKKVRGHVALTKVRASDQAPLKGVMFDLYQVVPDGEDLRIARNLETNEHGEWTSVGSERLFEESVDAGKKLSTGLPKGDYYFLEVAATEDTALDRQTKHSFTITTDGEVAHPDKTGTIVNQMFTANVKLKKLDEVSGANVSGATFTLTYAADSAVYSQEAVTNSSGEVTFQDLPKKGTYILEETMAPNGYDIAGVHGEDHKPFKAELILDDDDYKQTVVINRARVDAKKLTVLQGSITADGIPNPRLLGSVTLYKADGDEVSKALDGAEFTLYKKNEATNLWDRLKSFLTGGTYTVEGVLDGTALHEAGKLTITDLDWGTYRLVETKGADGYAAVDENGDPIEVEFTIDRDSNKNIALTSDGHSFYNYHTILVIQKQGTNGAALTGAEFKLEGTFVDETGKTVTGTKTLATDSKGQIVLEGVLIAGETYTLTETKAPSGYSLRTGSFRFRMEADGSTTVVRSASGYQLSKSEFFDNQIVVTDRRKSTTFKTGDSSDLTLWLSLTAASLTGLVTVLALSRKKKRNTKA